MENQLPPEAIGSSYIAPILRSGPSLPGGGWSEVTRRSSLSKRLNTKHVVAWLHAAHRMMLLLPCISMEFSCGIMGSTCDWSKRNTRCTEEQVGDKIGRGHWYQSNFKKDKIFGHLNDTRQELLYLSFLLRRGSNVRYINPLCEVFAGAKSNGSRAEENFCQTHVDFSHILVVFSYIDRFLGFG